MPRTVRTFIAATSAVAIAALSGCSLMGVPTEDNYPDDYEQALVDLLDATEIVVQHSADIDAWERTSSIPPYEAPVEITPRADQEQIDALLSDMIAIAETHGQPLPGFAFSSDDLGFRLVVGGTLTAEFAADGIDVALRNGWGSVAIYGLEDENKAMLLGGAETVDAAKELVTTPLPDTIQDALASTRVAITEISESAEISGMQSMITVDAIDVAAAVQPVIEDVPTAEGSATHDITSSVTGNQNPHISLRVEVRAEGLNDADAEDRPAIAEELGYTEYCNAIEEAAANAITDSKLTFECVATHVDIT